MWATDLILCLYRGPQEVRFLSGFHVNSQAYFKPELYTYFPRNKPDDILKYDELDKHINWNKWMKLNFLFHPVTLK